MLGPKKSYIEYSNKQLLDNAGKFVSKFPLRPSSSGDCRRKLAYQLEEWLGVATYDRGEGGAATKLRIFKMGDAVEYDLKRQFKDCKEDFITKYRYQAMDFYTLKDNFNKGMEFSIQGSNDDCFCPIDEFNTSLGKGLIDYKSKGDKFDRAFPTKWANDGDHLATIAQKFFDGGKRGDEAYWVEDLELFLSKLNNDFFERNFYQLNGYACTPFFVKHGVDHASIMQYNKNDSRVREIRFKPSMKVYEKCKGWFQDSLDAVAEGSAELAPRDYNLGSMVCSFCPYSKTCWEGADTTQAFFDTLPRKKWPVDLWKLKSPELKGLFDAFETFKESIVSVKDTEEKIVKTLLDLKTKKIKLDNGHVYELKFLKSPREHYELRRGKL